MFVADGNCEAPAKKAESPVRMAVRTFSVPLKVTENKVSTKKSSVDSKKKKPTAKKKSAVPKKKKTGNAARKTTGKKPASKTGKNALNGKKKITKAKKKSAPVSPGAMIFPAGPNTIPLKGVFNARDMGGYMTNDGRRVKEKKLLRSGELAYMTDSDVRILRDVYGLGNVVDLRYNADLKRCPDRMILGVSYSHLQMRNSKKKKIGKKARKRRKALTRAIRSSSRKFKRVAAKRTSCQSRKYAFGIAFSKKSKRAVRNCFEVLLNAEEDESTLIHCVYGKDRCGMMSAMILLALGVKDTTVCRDYAFSNLAASRIGMNKKIVKVRYLKQVLKKIRNKYGTYEKFFIRGIGISRKKLNRLRNMYLE
jgi:protein-tyrosine phosphatase